MEEYLSVLLPAMHDRKVSFTGDIWSAEVDGVGGLPGPTAPTVMLAAMGPRMLELAGARTDGSILWLSGPARHRRAIKPALDAAAAEAGRPAPRIVASVPVCVTDRADEVRALIATFLAGYNDLPSYRGVMDAEGADGPADVSLVGTEDEVRAGSPPSPTPAPPTSPPSSSRWTTASRHAPAPCSGARRGRLHDTPFWCVVATTRDIKYHGVPSWGASRRVARLGRFRFQG